jgi:hypothetical protein
MDGEGKGRLKRAVKEWDNDHQIRWVSARENPCHPCHSCCVVMVNIRAKKFKVTIPFYPHKSK